MAVPSTPATLSYFIVNRKLITATWAQSVDPDGLTPVVYTLEYRNAALAWVTIASGINALTYDWIPPAAMAGVTTKLRVKGVDPALESSGWRESVEFLVPPVDPPINLDTDVTLDGTQVSWESEYNVEGEYHDGTFWRTLFASANIDAYFWDTSRRKGNAKVRIRAVDVLDGATSVWVESAIFALTGKFHGNIWRAYIEAGALMLWKFNDVGVASVADSSGNNRNSTFSGLQLVNRNRPSLIFNRPNDGSSKSTLGSSTPHVVRAAGAEAWQKTVKTAILTYKPTTYGNSDALVTMLSRFNISYSSILSKIYSSIAGDGGVLLQFPTLPATGSAHTVATSFGGNRHANYLNGALVASRTMTTPGSVGQDIYTVSASGGGWNSDWQGLVMFADEMDALQMAWFYQVMLNDPNEIPTTPGVFVHPITGETYDLTIPISWGASTDPEANAIEYYGEYTRNGTTWLPLFDWQSATSYAWDTSLIYVGTSFQVRVKARDIYEEETAWRTSGVFNITHARAPGEAPKISWEWGSDYHLGVTITDLVPTEGPPTNQGVATLQIATDEEFTNVVATETMQPYDNFIWNKTAVLLTNTDYYLRALWTDEIGVLTPFSNIVRGRTARVIVVSPLDFIRAEDKSIFGRHGQYGVIVGGDGSSFLNLGWADVGYRWGINGQGVFIPDAAPVKVRWRINSSDPSNIIPMAAGVACPAYEVKIKFNSERIKAGIVGFRAPNYDPAALFNAWIGAIRIWPNVTGYHLAWSTADRIPNLSVIPVSTGEKWLNITPTVEPDGTKVFSWDGQTAYNDPSDPGYYYKLRNPILAYGPQGIGWVDVGHDCGAAPNVGGTNVLGNVIEYFKFSIDGVTMIEYEMGDPRAPEKPTLIQVS